MPNMEDIQFCVNFIIESAITLQEFDFDIVNPHTIKSNLIKIKEDA